MTEIESLETIGSEPLREHFYRANYAVFLDSIVGQLSWDIKDESENLWSEYAAKFPIASSHRYYVTISIDEEDEDGSEIRGEEVEATAFPVSLLYSMPDEWQHRLIAVMDAMRSIEEDENSYNVELLEARPIDAKKHARAKDPYADRWSQWDGDSDVAKLDPWYPYGK